MTIDMAPSTVASMDAVEDLTTSPNCALANCSDADIPTAIPDDSHAHDYLGSLAAELHLKIAEHLEGSDIKNLRTVCSSLYNHTIDTFADRRFRTRRHRYVPSALETLLEISATPVFARRIEVIVIETRRLDALIRLFPETLFADMQQQLCSVLKNLSRFGVCKRIHITPGPRSTHHNVAINSVCKALIESEYPLQSLSCTFWGFKCPTYFPEKLLRRVRDECPFDLPANQLYGLQRLLSSLGSLEISVLRGGEYHRDEDKLSIHWLVQALASCKTLPQLIISGEDQEWQAEVRNYVRELPLHSLAMNDMPTAGSHLVRLFLEDLGGSLRHLRLSRVAGRSWEVMLPWMGRLLTLDSIKLEGLVNIASNLNGKQKFRSEPYSYEDSGGPEQIRAHLRQVEDSGHDWEAYPLPGEDQNLEGNADDTGPVD